MKSAILEQIVNAVLYEGYILYPYRPTSKKNGRERFTFGRVYPKAYSDSQHGAEPALMQTECLLQVRERSPSIEITLGFLHPVWREVGHLVDGDNALLKMLPALTVDGVLYQTWQEAMEREVTMTLGALNPSARSQINFPFLFRASRALERISDGAGSDQSCMMRRYESLEGTLEVEAVPVAANLFKITVRVLNRTPISVAQCDDQDAVVMRTFASTHTILRATGGEFISMMDPPADFARFAGQCKNIGAWPVLVGDESKNERDTMLSSPIVLYDYPQIAPESSGSFFDGTEIDEMLTLRVMTMTDAEKLEMRRVDEQARRILKSRAEAVGAEELMKMHGTMRSVKSDEEFFNPTTPLKTVFTGGHELRAGSGVRIHPKKRADAIDMMLDGKEAFVEAIEQDAEGHVHLALVVNDDPGKDLGLARQPGHRFFYSVDEVEPLEKTPA